MAALALVLLVGSCGGLDLWAGRHVEDQIASLEARYGSLDEATLLVPAVPDADNRARVVRDAARITVPPAPDEQGSSVSRFIHRTPSPVPADVRAFVEANRAALRLAAGIGARRQSNWEIDPGNPDTMPSWTSLMTLSTAIYVAALMDMEDGRPDDAARTIGSGLAMMASFRQERDFVQIMRFNVQHNQFEAVRRLVTDSEPTRAALDELSAWLVENRAPDPMHSLLLAELKRRNAVFARMESGVVDSGVAGAAAGWIERRGARVDRTQLAAWLGPLARLGRPFVRQARLRYLQQMAHLLDVQSGPLPRQDLPEPPAPARWALIDRLASVDGAQNSIHQADDFSSGLGIAEVGVALRRFRLDRGTYPDDLSALVPAYVTPLPIDPFTGRPPAYAREGAGFTLRARRSQIYHPSVRTIEWRVQR